MSTNQIRVSFMLDYPHLNDNCSKAPHLRVGSSCNMPGLAVEILNLLTTYLNLTIDIVKVTPYVPGWHNVYEEVYDNLTDTYALLGEKLTHYRDRFDFTREVFPSNLKLIAQKKDHSLEDVFDFFVIYRLNTWISIFSAFLFFTLFGLFARYVEFKLELRKKCNFAEVLWKMIRLQLMQWEEIKYRLIAGRSSLLVFSVFQMCVILGSFQSLVLTSVVKKLNAAPFTVEEAFRLIRDNKLKLVASPGTINFLAEDIENNYDLKKALEANPYKMVKIVLDAVNTEEKEVTMLDELTWYKKRESYCDLIAIDGVVAIRSHRFMFRKGSRFTRMFNDAIYTNKYKIRQITQKYVIYRRPSKCQASKKGPLPLSITPYFGLLIIYAGGMLFASVVFAGELLKWRNLRKNNVASETENNEEVRARRTRSCNCSLGVRVMRHLRGRYYGNLRRRYFRRGHLTH